MKFALTIDTEGDNQWDHGRKLSVDNIKFIPRFQRLCEKYNIKPTYLVTSEVCNDAFAKDLFRTYIDNNVAEVGAHLHSWTTPPFLEREGFRLNDENHIFATELPEEILRFKIENLTKEIKDAFGISPTSFRSGRFGFNEKIGAVLSDNAYLVDSSITPFCSWSVNKGMPGGKGGPDFIDFGPQPFKYVFPSGPLFEIPVTIMPTRFPLNTNHNLAKAFFRNVDKRLILRVIRKVLYSNQPLWLRPLASMNIDLFRELMNEVRRLKLPIAVMMFHSSELMPGCSIYRKNEAEIEDLYVLLEKFFKMLNEENIDSLTLTEAVQKLEL